MLSDPATPGLIPKFLKLLHWETIVNIAEFNQLRCLEESGLVALEMLIEPFKFWLVPLKNLFSVIHSSTSHLEPNVGPQLKHTV